MSRRLLAIVVDCALIAAALLAAAILAADHASQLPGPRTVELGAALALLAIGAAYQSIFLHPCQGHAGHEIRRASGLAPSTASTPAAHNAAARLMALPLSVLPLGLGLAWALFDDNHLTWHDRLSRTYLRKW